VVHHEVEEAQSHRIRQDAVHDGQLARAIGRERTRGPRWGLRSSTRRGRMARGVDRVVGPAGAARSWCSCHVGSPRQLIDRRRAGS
jgi:hypothetical protein